MAKKQQPSDEQALTYIAGALLVGASAQATAKTLAPLLAVPAATLSPVLLLALSKALPPRVAHPATPTQISDQQEVGFRADYVWTAVKRLLAGGSIKDEQQYFNQHLDAGRNRHDKAVAIERAAKRYGPELGWHAKMDSLTSEECREANGRNFTAGMMPPIGYPGTVHPHCRCKPGRPFNTSLTVYDIKPHRRAA
jgi:hypothetical protein